MQAGQPQDLASSYVKEASLKSHWLSWALISLLISSMTTWLGPLEGLALNWNEVVLDFASLSRAVLPISGLLALGLMVLFALIGMFSKPRATALASALAVGLCIQHRVLVWDYGVFDGSPIDWGAYTGRAILELIAWGGLLGAALIRPSVLAQRTLPIVAIVIALELVSVATVVVGRTLPPRSASVTTGAAKGHKAATAVQDLAMFSSESNVIIVVLDMFQSDFFAEAMRDEVLQKQMPPGFTYYRNSASPYPSTRLSLQSILTSRTLNDPEVELDPWQRRQMENSVPNLLAHQGYRSHLLAMAPRHLTCNFETYDYRCDSHPRFIKLLEQRRATLPDSILGPHPDDVATLLNANAFRFTPHVLKPWLYNHGNWRMPQSLFGGPRLAGQDNRLFEGQRRDFVLIDAIRELASSESPVPTFKFFHFFSPHRPHGVDASCQYNGSGHDKSYTIRQPMEERRSDAIGQAICILKRLYGVFARLDEIGVYDSSLIFVLGDHGNSNVTVDRSFASPEIPQSMRRSEKAPKNPANNSPVRTNRYVPLFLVKQPNQQGTLQISDLPVSLTDVPASIFSVLNLENDFDGESIFELGDRRKAVRIAHVYPAWSKGRESTYDFIEFEIDGHSWYPGSWRLANPSLQSE